MGARTIAEIEDAMTASINTAIPNASTSYYAEWKLWRSIIARAIWTFENILYAFKAEIETTIQTKQPGSFEWYQDKIFEFQGTTDSNGNFQGDDLIIIGGVISYQTPDDTKKIIKQASLRASNGVLAVKVAKKLDENNYQALTASEQLAFSIYMDNIKYPGTEIQIISAAADLIKYTLQIIYDPVYTTSTVGANIAAKLNEYRASLGFDDRIYPFKMIDKIMEAEGVVSVKNNGIYRKAAGESVFTAIDITYTLAAGYFNYEKLIADGGTSSLTYTSYKTL